MAKVLTPFEILKGEFEAKYPELKDRRGRIPRTEEWNRRNSEAHKGQVSPTKGKHFSEESKRKCSEAHMGKPAWNKGIPVSATAREKDSLAHIGLQAGKKHGMFGKHHTKEAKAKMSSARAGKPLSEEHKESISLGLKGKLHTAEHTSKIIAASHTRPSKPEIALGDILESLLPGQYRYTGNGDVVINGINPDFLGCNRKRKIIELFGNYWHSKNITGKGPYEAEQTRIAKFAFLGFDCLVIWERELEQKSLNKLIDKILNFNKTQEKGKNEERQNLCTCNCSDNC